MSGAVRGFRRIALVAPAAVIAVGACVFVVGPAVIQGMHDCIVVQGDRFDADGWASGFPCDHRNSMATDLVQSRLPVGMTRDEVVRLLGKPDDYQGTYAADHTLAYDLGGFIDTDWLVVEFDDGWRLTRAFVCQD